MLNYTKAGRGPGNGSMPKYGGIIAHFGSDRQKLAVIKPKLGSAYDVGSEMSFKSMEYL